MLIVNMFYSPMSKMICIKNDRFMTEASAKTVDPCLSNLIIVFLLRHSDY